MTLENISTDELKAELERREKQVGEAEKPRQLDHQDYGPLRKICQDYIDDLDDLRCVDEDHSHYIFECAMEAVFGKSVWGWINKMKS